MFLSPVYIGEMKWMVHEVFLVNSSRLRKFKKPTKREKFLAEIWQLVPWKEFYSLIYSFYPKTGKVRSPLGLECMIRIHFLQNWFNLSDLANVRFSTKQKEKKSAPHVCFRKKESWQNFSMKIHTGVDRDNETIHSLVADLGGLHDPKMKGELLHGKKIVFRDSPHARRTDEIRGKKSLGVKFAWKRGTKNGKLSFAGKVMSSLCPLTF